MQLQHRGWSQALATYFAKKKSCKRDPGLRLSARAHAARACSRRRRTPPPVARPPAAAGGSLRSAHERDRTRRAPRVSGLYSRRGSARCALPPHRASPRFHLCASRGAAPRSSCGPLPLRRRLRRLRLADSVICQAGGGEGSEGSAAAARDSERTRPPTPLALAAPIAATVGRTRPSFPHARACCARRSVGRRPAARGAYAALQSRAGGARSRRRPAPGSPASAAPSAEAPSRPRASAAADRSARSGRPAARGAGAPRN